MHACSALRRCREGNCPGVELAGFADLGGSAETHGNDGQMARKKVLAGRVAGQSEQNMGV
jgi:hypothetical protein